MPRTSTPAALNGEDASAWPSTIGAAMRMPSTLEMRSATAFIVGERRFQRLHQQVAVEAQDLAEQFLAEAVHHRHHDDERRDAKHDAEEREGGDDRNKSFLAPRSQVAQRQHPFNGAKGRVPTGSLIFPYKARDFIRFWRISSQHRAARRLANAQVSGRRRPRPSCKPPAKPCDLRTAPSPFHRAGPPFVAFQPVETRPTAACAERQDHSRSLRWSDDERRRREDRLMRALGTRWRTTCLDCCLQSLLSRRRWSAPPGAGQLPEQADQDRAAGPARQRARTSRPARSETSSQRAGVSRC